ncbi:MAG: potassium transporter [Gammaproteobacteria bacterium]|nr:potassium transporter [Gammaproteobacteria bacterium]
MNYSLIKKILGIMLMMFSVTLIFPMIISLIYQDNNLATFILSSLIILFFGLFFYLPNKNIQHDINIREGFLIVVLFWVVLSIFGSIPFMIDPQLSLSFSDALFESTSGWTTTGATIISNLDDLSYSILIYRQELQWLGGMGIVILALAILPMLGVGGMQLYKAETTGPIKDNKISPRIAETAKNLWSVYIGLTVLCAVSYYAVGMNIFDAIAHSFSTIAIGGFSTHSQSIGYFNNYLIEIICIVFMLLSAINFVLHYMFLKNRDIKIYKNDGEVSAYLFLIIFIILVLLVFLYISESKNINLRHIIFQAVSFITTSGFTSTNYTVWPSFILTFLIIISFVGACTGSTGGGIKIMRIVLLFKLAKKELMKILHPSAEIPIKLNEKIVSEDVSTTVWSFFVLYLFSYFIISLILFASGTDFLTAFSATAACLNNLGPALGVASDNYSLMNDFSKYLLSFTMLLGRLEIFTLLIILTPYFWKY